MSELLRAQQIASALGVTTNRVYDLARENKIPHVRIGKSIRFPRDMWEEWVRNLAAQLPKPLTVEQQNQLELIAISALELLQYEDELPVKSPHSREKQREIVFRNLRSYVSCYFPTSFDASGRTVLPSSATPNTKP
jgi:excisionase family DNA binding protein